MMRLLCAVALLAVHPLFGQGNADNRSLTEQIQKADSAYFRSLNDCDLPTYESFLADDFELYHDRGGFTATREAEMKSMQVFCGEQRQRQRLRR